MRDSPEPHSTYPVDSDPTSTVPAVIDNVEKCRKPMQNFYARFLVFFVVAQTRWRSWPQTGTTNHVSPTYLRVGKSLDVRQIHVFFVDVADSAPILTLFSVLVYLSSHLGKKVE